MKNYKDRHTATSNSGIDESTLPLLQKASFFFFLIVSLSIVLNVILALLIPDRPSSLHDSPAILCIQGLFALGFLLATVQQSLAWMGPALLLALVPFHLSSHIASMYSLCAFLIATVELYRMDFFKRAGLFKIVMMFVYYGSSIALVGITLSVSVIEIIIPILFILLSFLFLLPIFQGKRQISILRSRQKIRYKDLNLSERETDFLRDCLDGATFKEIATRHHVSESTVRNTFAHIYHKFGVTDRASLLSQFADFDIID